MKVSRQGSQEEGPCELHYILNRATDHIAETRADDDSALADNSEATSPNTGRAWTKNWLMSWDIRQFGRDIEVSAARNAPRQGG